MLNFIYNTFYFIRYYNVYIAYITYICYLYRLIVFFSNAKKEKEK